MKRLLLKGPHLPKDMPMIHNLDIRLNRKGMDNLVTHPSHKDMHNPVTHINLKGMDSQ
jgi:hypothetical protein